MDQSVYEQSYKRDLPTHVGGISSGWPMNHRTYVGWHYVVNNISEAPTDDKVIPGMQLLDEPNAMMYKFNDDCEWVVDLDLTSHYQTLVTG